jgi:hypothetical protein
MATQQDSPQSTEKKVALVHDFLVAYGGAERVFEAIAEMYPEAPIYTLLADPKLIEGHFKGRDICVSWLSKLPKFLKKRYRFFLPFFPAAVESFDLGRSCHLFFGSLEQGNRDTPQYETYCLSASRCAGGIITSSIWMNLAHGNSGFYENAAFVSARMGSAGGTTAGCVADEFEIYGLREKYYRREHGRVSWRLELFEDKDPSPVDGQGDGSVITFWSCA